MGSVMIANNPIPRNFVRKVVVAFVLIVSSCFLFVALILTGLTAIYLSATQAGYGALETVLAIVGTFAVLMVVCVIATIQGIRKALDGLSTDFKHNVPLPMHIANQASNAVHSFVDGLMDRKEQRMDKDRNMRKGQL